MCNRLLGSRQKGVEADHVPRSVGRNRARVARVAPSQQREAAWSAQQRRGVRALERQAIASKAVDVRGEAALITVRAEHIPRNIIRDDEQDVRSQCHLASTGDPTTSRAHSPRRALSADQWEEGDARCLIWQAPPKYRRYTRRPLRDTTSYRTRIYIRTCSPIAHIGRLRVTNRQDSTHRITRPKHAERE